MIQLVWTEWAKLGEHWEMAQNLPKLCASVNFFQLPVAISARRGVCGGKRPEILRVQFFLAHWRLTWPPPQRRVWLRMLGPPWSGATEFSHKDSSISKKADKGKWARTSAACINKIQSTRPLHWQANHRMTWNWCSGNIGAIGGIYKFRRPHRQYKQSLS
jgi:hypothetical protein